MRALNLALKFLLELCAIGLLCAWGLRTGDGWLGPVLGLAAPSVMVVVWGRYAAPRAPRRLGTRLRVPLELGVFAIAGALGFAAGLHVLAAAFLALVVLNAVGLTVLGQWEG